MNGSVPAVTVAVAGSAGPVWDGAGVSSTGVSLAGVSSSGPAVGPSVASVTTLGRARKAYMASPMTGRIRSRMR